MSYKQDIEFTTTGIITSYIWRGDKIKKMLESIIHSNTKDEAAVLSNKFNRNIFAIDKILA